MWISRHRTEAGYAGVAEVAAQLNPPHIASAPAPLGPWLFFVTDNAESSLHLLALFTHPSILNSKVPWSDLRIATL